jgi:beta-lactamase superfamily II metal-dependent hydrolase
MALTGTITVFNVGDADAILVELEQGGEDLVVVVDGGKKSDYHSHMKGPLQAALQRTNKKGPDLVVLTHYDADHILGISELVKDYGENIGRLWAHSPPADFDTKRPFLEKLAAGNMLKFSDFVERDELLHAGKMLTGAALKEAAEVLLESLPQLRELEALFPGGTKPVFAGDSYPGWPIKVLGPSRSYYDSMFNRRRSTKDLLITEAMNTAPMRRLTAELEHMQELTGITESAEEAMTPCEKLGAVKDRGMSNTNLASIVFTLEATEGKYLFTGDAGVPSFEGIDGNLLKDLYWLKVPHHGSERNLTTELISLMKPQYADCSGGKDYQDDHVLKCIGKNAYSKRKVRSTYWEKKHLQFSIGSDSLGH